MRRTILGMLMFLVGTVSVSAADVITELKVTPEMSIFEKAVWNKPLEIKSLEDAGKHFGKEALETLKKSVDFDKQIVLVFAWQGSGQDKLEYQILESFPEQIPFSLKRGLTRDLRQHAHVYVLRNNARWSTK